MTKRTDSPISTRRDRPEIEITPEMVEAGANAIDPLDEGIIDHWERAELIWLAMERVRLSCK